MANFKHPETIGLHGGEYRSDPATTAVVAGSLLYSPPCKPIVSGCLKFAIFFSFFSTSTVCQAYNTVQMPGFYLIISKKKPPTKAVV